MAKNGKINFFTTRMDDKQWVREKIMSHFVGTNISENDIRISNMTVIFNLNQIIDIESVCENDFDMDALFDITQSNSDQSKVKILDRRTFSALRTSPFRDSKISLNVFDSGNCVACGLKTKKDIERVSNYILQEYNQK